MHLVQVLLPVYDNAGQRFPAELYRAVRDELTVRFGGLTAYTRAPAEGLWRDGPGGTVRDDIAIYEVMTDALDRAWWTDYRRSLETRFRQEQLVIRVQECTLL
jgi:hypothetical protein